MNMYTLLYIEKSSVRPIKTTFNLSKIQEIMREIYNTLMPTDWSDECKNKSFINDKQAVLVLNDNEIRNWHIIETNMTATLNDETNENLINMIDELKFDIKDKIFRHLHKEYLRDDFNAHGESLDITLNEEQLNQLCNMWVYQGKYDCNLSYWDNIENLIKEVVNNN